MKKFIVLIAGPLLFIALTVYGEIDGSSQLFYRALGLASWMIVWWVGEVVSISVTALLPIVILAPAGILTLTEATAPYASPVIFLFMGGFLIALGLEKHNLHLRIALNLLRLTGSSGNGVILGFLLASAILSMWISNTATAVMMLPIAISVTNLLLDQKKELTKNESRFALGLMLTIAYAANIGGAMTLIGTPPNVVMAGYLDGILHYEMTFSKWFAVGLPAGILLLAIMYFFITRVMYPNNLKEIEGSKQLVQRELQKIGPISREEKLVLTVFFITAAGWVFKNQFNALVGYDLLTDHITAMIGGILMFITPVSFKKAGFLIDWEDTKRMPWGILILFGGGMSLAKGLEKVGFIQLMGQFVEQLGDVHLLMVILVAVTLVLFLTELMSNVALVTIFIPVIIGVAQGLKIDPLLLVVPCTMASSYAFMMPISTPPNAIVFSSGRIRFQDMMRAGIVLNIIAILVLVVLDLVIVNYFF